MGIDFLILSGLILLAGSVLPEFQDKRLDYANSLQKRTAEFTKTVDAQLARFSAFMDKFDLDLLPGEGTAAATDSGAVPAAPVSPVAVPDAGPSTPVPPVDVTPPLAGDEGTAGERPLLTFNELFNRYWDSKIIVEWIGQTELVRMISDRKSIDAELQKIIDSKTSDWGITVQSVEIRDMKIPAALEDAMSRKAQADREKEARIILAESELRVADEMEKAARVYNRDPIALQIRAMNMTYESIKERGALMVVPSEMMSSMNGSLLGMGTACFERETVVN